MSNEEKAQGIRRLDSDEVGDTHYLFKINIGAEDLRLYGYRVALTIVDDVPRTLICFDQAVSHDKTLKHIHKQDAQKPQ